MPSASATRVEAHALHLAVLCMGMDIIWVLDCTHASSNVHVDYINCMSTFPVCYEELVTGSPSSPCLERKHVFLIDTSLLFNSALKLFGLEQKNEIWCILVSGYKQPKRAGVMSFPEPASR